jgi:hypothetical protein
MQNGRKKRQEEQNELKALREEKRQQDIEKLKEKVTEKIVKKAINYKKKHHTKIEILEALSESSDDGSLGIERKVKKVPKAETSPKKKLNPRLPLKTVTEKIVSSIIPVPLEVEKPKFIYCR